MKSTVMLNKLKRRGQLTDMFFFLHILSPTVKKDEVNTLKARPLINAGLKKNDTGSIRSNLKQTPQALELPAFI